MRTALGVDRIKQQLGGNNPDTLAQVAEMCEQWEFSEINLNCGCPSSKVSDRCFGARLMLVRALPPVSDRMPAPICRGDFGKYVFVRKNANALLRSMRSVPPHACRAPGAFL